MLRTKASVLILALMVAPLVSLCAIQSGTAKQCPSLCPMMHGGTHETAGQTDEMECQHGKSTKQDCVMKSGCSHTLDLGFASPLPPAVLWLSIELLAAGANGTARFTGSNPSLAGFKVPPFQPPRAEISTAISQ